MDCVVTRLSFMELWRVRNGPNKRDESINDKTKRMEIEIESAPIVWKEYKIMSYFSMVNLYYIMSGGKK